MDNNITPYWQEVNRIIEEDILAPANNKFLQNLTLKQHTVVGYDKDKVSYQLSFVMNHFGLTGVKQILNDEPEFGTPDLHDLGQGLIGSTNSLQMLYHIAYWEDTTNTDFMHLKTILEWGGGFGALARIALKLNPELNYHMIDTPTFAKLQHFYLVEELGLPNVYIYSIDNLIGLDKLKADLFISTWALSESPRSAIEQAAFFPPIKNAEHVLLAYQQTQPEFEAAGEVVDILNTQRAIPIVNIKSVPYSVGADWYATC